MTDGTTTEKEGKRARVRRLLIEPLAEDGMRFKKTVPKDRARAHLDRIADDFAYMSDRGLSALRRSLSTMGEGSARCFWPQYVTIRGVAQTIEAAPFEDEPALVRWFQSRAGLAAKEHGRAVAEYLFFRKKCRPPLHGERGVFECRLIAERASEMSRRAELVRDRIDRGVLSDPSEAEWLNWYDGLEKHVLELISKKGEAA